MRHFASLTILVAMVLVVEGCGGGKERLPASGVASSQVKTPRATPSIDRTVSDLPRDWYVSQNDGRGLMLLNFSTDDIWIYVAVDGEGDEPDLQAALDGHRRAVNDSPAGTMRDTGVVDTATLGQAAWSWGTFADDEESREELVLFVPHPRRRMVMSLRYLFPSDGGEIAPRLEELVAVADAVVPEF